MNRILNIILSMVRGIKCCKCGYYIMMDEEYDSHIYPSLYEWYPAHKSCPSKLGRVANVTKKEM